MKRKKKRLMTVEISKDTPATPAFINSIRGLVSKERKENGGWVLKVSRRTGKWLIHGKIAKIVENSSIK